MKQDTIVYNQLEEIIGNEATGRAARAAIRAGVWTGPTAGLAPGYSQANLVILPHAYAFDFIRFCLYNPKTCPLLDVTSFGSPHPAPHLAQDADLRVDLPRYRIYQDGELVAEPTNITNQWRQDAVAFLLGCSFTFEHAMLAAGLPLRHLECDCNVPMFRTNQPCQPAGIFHGPLVVSMRPIPKGLVERAIQVTARYPSSHGEPIHIGDPAALGIKNLAQPDYGDPVPIYAGEVPVFWACGVTPQAVAQAVPVPWMITHAPGHMFITDQLMKS